MIPFLVAINFLSLEIMADALVMSRNFLYLLFDWTQGYTIFGYNEIKLRGINPSSP